MSKSKSKKLRKIIILSVIVLVIAGSSFYAFRKKELPVTVQKEKVIRRNLTELVVANGKIQPVVQVKISPEVSGEITELPIKEGQRVKKGDLLLKIKPDNYRASRDSSRASFEYSMTSSNSAMASLERAELEYKRNKELHDAKLVSDSTYQECKTSYDIARSALAGAVRQVDMAYASLAKAEDDLSKTIIYAPLDGTITKLNSQLGERVVGTAMMAGTEIMTIADLNEMETRVDIGEIDVVLIKVGQTARLEVDAFKDRKFKGTVTEIANSAKTSVANNSQEATKFEVRIRVDEKEEFRPGMSVTAEIETRCRTNVLSVPIQSVTTRLPKGPKDGKTNTVAAVKGGTNNVSTNSDKASEAVAVTTTNSSGSTNMVDAKSKKKPGEPEKPIEVVFVLDNNHVKMVSVKRGISDDSYTEITDGLQENQEVVSGGYKAIARELEDGKLITVGVAKPDAEKK